MSIELPEHHLFFINVFYSLALDVAAETSTDNNIQITCILFARSPHTVAHFAPTVASGAPRKSGKFIDSRGNPTTSEL